jgi:hypothetical protein
VFCCGYDPGALLFLADPAGDEVQGPLPDLVLTLASAAFALTTLGILALTAAA